MAREPGSKAGLQDRVEEILGGARCGGRVKPILVAAALAAVMAVGQVGVAAVARLAQTDDPISDVQLRQVHAYVTLIAQAGSVPAPQVWHELRLYLDVDAIDRVKQAQFDRAVDWLDRRARRALERTVSGENP